MPRRFRFQAQGRDQGEMASGAVAGQRDARGINTKLLRVPVDNRSTSFCIIVRRRKVCSGARRYCTAITRQPLNMAN